MNPAPTAASSTRLPFFSFPSLEGRLHGQRKGAGGGVAVAVDVDDDLLHRHLQAIGGGGDDALVGLMGDEAIHVSAGEIVALQHALGHLRHFLHRILEYLLSILMNIMHLIVDCFV